MVNKRTAYFILLALTTVWCGLLVLPPIAAALEAPSTQLSSLFYRFFSRICHQYDFRSLYIFGYPLAVCARCSAIYFGFLVGVLVTSFLEIRVKKYAFGRAFGDQRNFSLWFTIVLLPMLLDVLLDTIGLHPSSFFTRVTTGLIFGGGVGILLSPLFVDPLVYLLELPRRNHHAKA